ncbi:alpha/beta fold hydrolase [Nocardia jejuensis]|uniref:alpha/beta fold hydrolase n=1 Tax=Nocardia jejuensis TaxID=328049 RepID=UPI000830ADA4|nr:alpha/beta fold hydrolase [Nocardia jejuensis]
MAKVGRFTRDADKSAYLRAYDEMARQWPVPVQDIDVETTFGTTRVRRSGNGPGAPLVLLPGFGGNSLFWTPFIEELARERTVYALDVIGWAGRSEQRAPMRDAGDLAAWVGEVIEGLALDRVHLAGYSLGAWIAMVAAAFRPELCVSVSVLEPAPVTFGRPTWRVLIKFMTAGARPTRARMEKFNAWLSPGLELPETAWAMVLAGLKFRIAPPWPRTLTNEQFAAATAPMLVLFGAETVLHDPGVVAERVRGLFPAADIEIYPGVGHEMLWKISDAVIARVLGFVGAHDAVRA